MAVAPNLLEAIRTFDALLRPLQDYAIRMDEPGWLARLNARKRAMASKHADEQRLREEIDHSGVIPRLIDSYLAGDDDDRRELRALFAECKCFARNWGPDGRRLAFPQPPATAEQMLRAFAVQAMRDGKPDYRDEILLLDGFCKLIQQSGLDPSTLLQEAAKLASAEPRGGRKSFRDAIRERAARS